MCLPCPCSFSARVTTGGPGDDGNENVPLNQQGAPVITQQPARGEKGKATVDFIIKVGGGDFLETIQNSGQVLTSFLDNQHTQKALTSCDRRCTPWCKEHCPECCSWLLSCCFDCCINGEEHFDPKAAHDFVKEMKEKYGPICVGMALGNGGGEVLLQNIGPDGSVDHDKKSDFENRCIQCSKELGKRLGCEISRELFETANNPQNCPGINSILVQRLTELVEAKHEGKGIPVAQNLPTFWVLHDNIEEDEGGGGGRYWRRRRCCH
ncbi:hypothetical protein [Chlamydia sp. 17-3921]|uniref:hypothetical protein n=1 Tax=Chlamydia sp. 17-3921 TaxID=2675798 RepID=UPI0019198649|nr:hypothetical protein [Chlamydia sp. 17-3921]